MHCNIDRTLFENAFHEACRKTDEAYFERRGNKEAIIEYADRNDSIDIETLQELLDADNPVLALEDKLAGWYEGYETMLFYQIAEDMAIMFANKHILRNKEVIYDALTSDESMSENHCGFKSDISDVIDHIKEQMVHTVISLDCHEATHEFYKSDEAPFDEKHWPAAYLLKSLGATDESIQQELENSTSNINATILLCNLSVGQLLEIAAARKGLLDKKFEGVKFQSNTEAGFFDNVNGGGSVLGIEFKSDFTIPENAIYTILPDGKNKFTPDWSVDSVYGLTSSAWKDAEPVWKEEK